MRVLVTGGTGFVGRAVVGALQDRGHTVRVLSRGARSAPPGAACLAGSVLRPDSLPGALDGCEAVVHLVGIISEVGDQTYERVHVDGTRNVVKAARAGGVGRFVHMSALGTRPEARSRYHRSKWAAEEAVRSSGLAWTLLRPGLIYGPGDGFVNLFAGMIRRSPVLPVVGPGTCRLQPVAVEDVARCVAGALEIQESVGRTLDLCGRESLTLNEILSEILRAMGRSRVRVHLPWSLANAQARMLEWVFPRLLGKASPMNRDQILMLQEDNIGDPEPACRLFGFEPVPFPEGLRRWL